MKKKKKIILMSSLLVFLAIFGVSQEAFAVGTSYITASDMTTATENITATVDDVKSKTFPIMVLVTGITIMFGLFKKFTKKAAS